MNRLAVVPLVLSVALCGCAAPSGEQIVSRSQALLDERSVSTSSVEQLTRKPLPLKPADISLDEQAEVFDIGGQKSYVAVFELPSFQRPYSVTLSSNPDGPPLDIRIFVPRVTVLDDQFKVTRSFTEDGLRSRGRSLERTVFFNPGNSRDRYLLIHSGLLRAAYQRDVQLLTNQTISAGAVTMNWADGQDAKGMVRPSPVGKVELTVDGLSTAAY